MDIHTTRSRRLGLALGGNLVLAAGQLVAGLFAHSLGLVSDAGHNVTDAAGIAMALVAVRMTLRPASPTRSFGYHRGTILAALANAVIIAAVTVAIAVAAVQRLLHPHAVHGAVVVGVAAVALVANGAMALSLFERNDLNMRAAATHLAGDALASLAILAAGAVLVVDPALRWADPVASLAVAALIVVEAVRILRASVDVLLESAPTDVDLGNLTAAMGRVEGVSEVHDLHVWSLSGDVRALSAHLVLSGHPTLEEAQVVGDAVKRAVAGPFAIAHSTLELECERCVDDTVDPCLIDLSDAEAGRSAT